ncbi:MAG: TolC family outer membrane protein [Methylobacteriaceae bacterium]|jgi:outer membrane protein|nr:TolC family outer membrane protein [Methylobacteriaceae bacterium]
MMNNGATSDVPPAGGLWSVAAVASLILALLAAAPASAETLSGALAKAYQVNPELNAERAGLRAADENVARAKSGYRPAVSAAADYSRSRSRYDNRLGWGITKQAMNPRGYGLQVNLDVFSGFRTKNAVSQAETQVEGGRETLRNAEGDILFLAAQAYMNVLRDTAILRLQRNNVELLAEQLRQTKDRLSVGDVTVTDYSQAEARHAQAMSGASSAEADLRSSVAVYRQIIGSEPKKLNAGKPLTKLIPKTLNKAIALGLRQHPAILAAHHDAEAAALQVKIVEGEFYPTISLSGEVSHRYDTDLHNDEEVSAAVSARLTVPIYQRGDVSARTRQSKEALGQAHLRADATNDRVRAEIVSAWGMYESTRARITAMQAAVKANEAALAGVREEARVGQRTTLDILNAQQELLNMRVELIVAQRDHVIASYAVARAVGALNARALKLNTEYYDPADHFDQVKNLWVGTSIPVAGKQ